MDDFWVFGYGSLIWRPGFPYEERVRARLSGYRRALCVRSQHHRGTPERPGLVFGLDRGGSCVGMAYRVADGEREAVLAYLRERELVTHVYRETVAPLRLEDGRRVQAVAYVVRRDHRQYAGRIEAGEAAAIVRESVGQSGPNTEYVTSCLDHLREMGLRDAWLERVVAHL